MRQWLFQRGNFFFGILMELYPRRIISNIVQSERNFIKSFFDIQNRKISNIFKKIFLFYLLELLYNIVDIAIAKLNQWKN